VPSSVSVIMQRGRCNGMWRVGVYRDAGVRDFRSLNCGHGLAILNWFYWKLHRWQLSVQLCGSRYRWVLIQRPKPHLLFSKICVHKDRIYVHVFILMSVIYV
jgi:hypothetical protein